MTDLSTVDPAAIAAMSQTPGIETRRPLFGEMHDLGVNWRLQFADADGVPFNMQTFEAIDFGAISYKEIFQNVKTILATPLYSAALERLLGVDGRIVDLPNTNASEATIAILTAVYFWEPRAHATDIKFPTSAADVIDGHLKVALKLQINNVIFGTSQSYDRANIFDAPTQVTQKLPPMQEPILIPGPPGATGRRGSLWFTGTTDPPTDTRSTSVADALPNDIYLNTTTGDVFQLDGTGTTLAWRKINR